MCISGGNVMKRGSDPITKVLRMCNNFVMGSDPNVVQLSKYRYFNSVSAFERGAIFLTFFPQEG